VKLFKGVEKWFKMINAYGRKNGVIIEHYIVGSRKTGHWEVLK
jgi:hypothetical protein